ncbi:hypothetical protein Skr01_58170 [Sphaerisporangium krabiense]|uniref:Nitrate reductase alpha subunit n=1 Tax=Sphaerisporangium krabiense TaxID=763782 RepID=A0A7W8Z8N5_9ACTN|nr:nitrate reductase alpha subunit [Sphaerisporangium krabiense]GII65732.1 hypothetical protein Skr01_58170 [Sphaerisporangium krabiense]
MFGRAPRALAEKAAATAARRLLEAGKLLHRSDTSPDLRALYRPGDRVNDAPYRERWAHDRVVRSTHGVNCTGSCSWKVYVKDGLITWETQQTDYPSVGPDRPEYEPRGCPRGAAFSWYTYSPTRVRYPHARGVLVEMYRQAKAELGTRSRRGGVWSGTRTGAGATSRPGAGAAWCGSTGTRPWRSPPPRTSTRS